MLMGLDAPLVVRPHRRDDPWDIRAVLGKGAPPGSRPTGAPTSSWWGSGSAQVQRRHQQSAGTTTPLRASSWCSQALAVLERPAAGTVG